MSDQPDVSFILTSDNRLGICWTPNKEAGGAEVIKWCPDSMIKAAFRRVLDYDCDGEGVKHE